MQVSKKISKKRKLSLREGLLEERANPLFLLLFIFIPLFSQAEYSFTFNSNCLAAQQKNYELQLEPAAELLSTQSDSFPENLAVNYLSDFNLFLKAFITEETVHIDHFLSLSTNSLKKYSQLNELNPYRKFAIAETYFYRAVIKGKQNNLLSAATDISRAYDYIEDNHKAFPEFIQNNKTRGIIKVYLSALPDNYKWATKLLGFEGDLDQGMQMLKKLAHTTEPNTELNYVSKEAAYYYSFALYHVEHKPNTAWLETLKCTSDYSSNNMSAFFRSNMALKIQKNEMAIKTLKNRPQHDGYFPFYFLDYQLGIAKLNRLDIDAIEYLKKYKDNFNGKSYVKSCHQKISWYYLLAGDYTLHRKYKSDIKNVGHRLSEDDTQAENYAEKPTPNRYLLKARLQCDGGYYTEALLTIKKTSTDEMKTNTEKAEYCYRKGKIFEFLGESEVAIKFYEACSLYGVESKEYYAAYACLYIADYHLKNGDKSAASEYYKKALTYKYNTEYTDSIEQRAKSGIKKAV